MPNAPDWPSLVRDRLPSLGLAPPREAEVVEELSLLLEEFHAAENAPPQASPDFEPWLQSHVPAWSDLKAEIGRTETSLGRRLASGSQRSGPTPRQGDPMMLNSLTSDLRFALRKLGQSPGFALVAILTLGLSIGLNSAIFSVVNAVLFRPLPVESPESLAHVYTEAAEKSFLSHFPVAHPDYRDIAAAMRDTADSGLADVAAYTFTLVNLDDGENSDFVMGELVSGNYFDMLGIAPSLGRPLSPADDRPNDAQTVAVMNHRTWQNRYGGDPSIIGRTLRLNGHAVTVIGVAPEGFNGLTRGLVAELWIPMQLARTLVTTASLRQAADMDLGEPGDNVHILDDRGRRFHWMIGRLAPGASFEAARGEIETLAARLAAAHPETNAERRFSVIPAAEVSFLPGVDGAIHAASWVILALVGLVLLIAAANVANMLLARAVGRQKEIATRLALGAGRAVLVRQLLIESLVLALFGGFLGLVLTFGSNRLLDSVGHAMPLPVQTALGLAVDLRVLAFTILVSTLTALAFGLAPALESTRADLTSALHEAGRGHAGGRRRKRLSGALVIAQVALSMVLLICAGLSVRSMVNALRIDPGFTAEGLVTASFAPQYQGYDQVRTEAFYDRLTERLEALPEVQSVAWIGHLPLTFEVHTEGMAIQGEDTVPVEDWPGIDTALISPGYFETLRMPLLAGRGFSHRDAADRPLVAVVNESFARRFWPDENPIGKRLRVEGKEGYYEVVGLARDGKYRTLGESPRPFVYRSLDQHFKGDLALVVRTAGHPAATLASVRHAARELDERIAIAGLSTLEEAISGTLLLPRAGAALFGLFGLIGLVLAAVGLYGVVAYAVSQRTHEIGIRMAMGARRGDILAMVVREGFVLIAVGVGLGLAGAFAVTRALSAILYGVGAQDAGTFLLVALFLVSVALVASYIPARRAAGTDPLQALRHE